MDAEWHFPGACWTVYGRSAGLNLEVRLMADAMNELEISHQELSRLVNEATRLAMSYWETHLRIVGRIHPPAVNKPPSFLLAHGRRKDAVERCCKISCQSPSIRDLRRAGFSDMSSVRESLLGR